MNISPAWPELPSSRAMILPRPGADSMVSLSIPSSASHFSMYRHSSVSLPVGMKPVLTVGMRTMSCSSATISSRISSTWSSRSFKSGIGNPPLSYWSKTCLIVMPFPHLHRLPGEIPQETTLSLVRGRPPRKILLVMIARRKGYTGLSNCPVIDSVAI